LAIKYSVHGSLNKRIKSINKKSKGYEIKFIYITNRCGQQAR
jgi:hypothetical protein